MEQITYSELLAVMATFNEDCNCFRDVAARNCLIGIDGSLKLSDFGLSRRLEDLK